MQQVEFYQFRGAKGKVAIEDMEWMYWDKTNERLDQLRKDDAWAKVLACETITLNGQVYTNYAVLKEEVRQAVEWGSFDNLQKLETQEPETTLDKQKLGDDILALRKKIRHIYKLQERSLNGL